MSYTRFPKAKYLRQLRQMREDMWLWSDVYGQRQTETDQQWIVDRYELRENALRDGIRHVDYVLAALESLPRLR